MFSGRRWRSLFRLATSRNARVRAEALRMRFPWNVPEEAGVSTFGGSTPRSAAAACESAAISSSSAMLPSGANSAPRISLPYKHGFFLYFDPGRAYFGQLLLQLGEDLAGG